MRTGGPHGDCRVIKFPDDAAEGLWVAADKSQEYVVTLACERAPVHE